MRTLALLPLFMVALCGGVEEDPLLRGAQGFDVQGHRGARGLRPENTLPSFETALDLGVTTLELDLHWSADGEVIVWHDAQISAAKCRLDSGARGPRPFFRTDAEVPDFALRIRSLPRVLIAAFRCDRNPDPRSFPEQVATPTYLAGDDYHIPSLDEVFAFVARYAGSQAKPEPLREAARRVRFNVETKRNPQEPWSIGDGFDGERPGPFERALVRLVREHGLAGRVIVQSFDHRSLWAVRELAPEIALAALTHDEASPAEYAERGAAIWSPPFRSLTGARLTEAHRAGLRVIPWTVNARADMRRLLEMGVDGIITDRPDRLRRLLPRPAPAPRGLASSMPGASWTGSGRGDA